MEGGHPDLCTTTYCGNGIELRFAVPGRGWQGIGRRQLHLHLLPEQLGQRKVLVAHPFNGIGRASAPLNLNMGWKGIYGSGFDASLFMTNALNEEYITFVSGMYNGTGADFGVTGRAENVGWSDQVQL